MSYISRVSVLDNGIRSGQTRSRAPGERAEDTERAHRETGSRAAACRREKARRRGPVPQENQPATQGTD